MLRYTVMDVPVGSLILVAGPRGLTNVVLTSKKREKAEAMARDRFSDATLDARLLPDLREQLAAYFAGQAVEFNRV
jgi:O6-methylguanine-DNA--protein-cysteine methyltransferase